MFGGSVYRSRGFSPSETAISLTAWAEVAAVGRPKLTRRVDEAETSMREAEVNYRAAQLRHEITRPLLMAAAGERVWTSASKTSRGGSHRQGHGQQVSGGAGCRGPTRCNPERSRQTQRTRSARTHNRLRHERFTLNRLLNRDVNAIWPSLQLPPVALCHSSERKLLAALAPKRTQAQSFGTGDSNSAAASAD